jgi:hypothetical protein
MILEGGCQCGAIRYQLTAEPERVSICHCRDCQKSAGAPMVCWAVMPKDQLLVLRGKPIAYNSSGETWRQFCGTCGTGLFYVNEHYLPGKIDLQTITLDDPSALPPSAQVQVADAPTWSLHMHELRAYQRYPES